MNGAAGRDRADESASVDTPATPRETMRSPVQPIMIFILNDHRLVRQGLRDLLEEEGFEVAGENGSAAEAIRLVPVLKPGIVLVDDNMPDGTGIEVCRNLQSTAPDVKCLILTGWDEHHALQTAVLAGAAGYVLKQLGDHNRLSSRIRSAARGCPPLPSEVRESVGESLYASPGARWLDTMTPQERTVFSLMAHGLTNRQIGQEMLLPDTTVASCVTSVLDKLGFRRLPQPAHQGAHHRAARTPS